MEVETSMDDASTLSALEAIKFIGCTAHSSSQNEVHIISCWVHSKFHNGRCASSPTMVVWYLVSVSGLKYDAGMLQRLFFVPISFFPDAISTNSLFEIQRLSIPISIPLSLSPSLNQWGGLRVCSRRYISFCFVLRSD